MAICKRFIRLVRYILPVCWMLAVWFVSTQPAEAKLSAAPPDAALQNADVILVGTVDRSVVLEDHAEAVIRVERTLKGTVDTSEIRLEKWPPMRINTERRPPDAVVYRSGISQLQVAELVNSNVVIKGPAPKVFPPAGSRVFAVLGGDAEHGYVLLPEINALGLIEDGHVTRMCDGGKFGTDAGSWEPADYVAAYDVYYHEHGVDSGAKTDASAGMEEGHGEAGAAAAGNEASGTSGAEPAPSGSASVIREVGGAAVAGTVLAGLPSWLFIRLVRNKRK